MLAKVSRRKRTKKLVGAQLIKFCWMRDDKMIKRELYILPLKCTETRNYTGENKLSQSHRLYTRHRLYILTGVAFLVFQFPCWCSVFDINVLAKVSRRKRTKKLVDAQLIKFCWMRDNKMIKRELYILQLKCTETRNYTGDSNISQSHRLYTRHRLYSHWGCFFSFFYFLADVLFSISMC